MRSLRGRGPGSGRRIGIRRAAAVPATDCLGLVRGVWREVIGQEPEAPPSYTPDWSETEGGGGRCSARRGGISSRWRSRRRGRATCWCSGCGTAASRSTSAFLARSGQGHPTLDSCLFRSRRGRVAADAGLGAADRRGLPLSRQECVMATLLLSATGAALGGGVGGSLAGLSTMVLGKAVGATLGSVLDQRLMGRGRRAGRDRAGSSGFASWARARARRPRVFRRTRVAGQLIWSSRFLETVTRGGGRQGRRRPRRASIAIP